MSNIFKNLLGGKAKKTRPEPQKAIKNEEPVRQKELEPGVRSEEKTDIRLTRNGPAETSIFLHEELIRLREIQECANRLLGKTEGLISDFETLGNTAAIQQDAAGKEALVEEIERHRSYCRRRLLELYNVIEEPNSLSYPFDGQAQNGRFETAEAAENDYGIHAQMHEKHIVLQLPMLGSNWRVSGSRSNDEDGVKMTYGTVFKQSVTGALERLFASRPDVDLESYREKTLHYFFVYGEHDRQIMDADNHSTKAITDAICSFLPGSDAGSTTGFFYKTCIRNWPPRGTYVVISPGNFVPESEAVLEEFVSAFVDFST